jgi:hypothetical protein
MNAMNVCIDMRGEDDMWAGQLTGESNYPIFQR